MFLYASRPFWLVLFTTHSFTVLWLMSAAIRANEKNGSYQSRGMSKQQGSTMLDSGLVLLNGDIVTHKRAHELWIDECMHNILPRSNGRVKGGVRFSDDSIIGIVLGMHSVTFANRADLHLNGEWMKGC